MDALGNSIPAKSIKIIGPTSTIEPPQDQAFDLNYGEYTIEVSVPGAERAKLRVIVDQPAQILTIGLKLARMEDVDPPPCMIWGHIAPESKAVRIRAVQLFGPSVIDVPVDRGGLFEVRGLACGGDYLLMAMASGKLLGTMAAEPLAMPRRIEMRVEASARNHGQ